LADPVNIIDPLGLEPGTNSCQVYQDFCNLSKQQGDESIYACTFAPFACENAPKTDDPFPFLDGDEKIMQKEMWSPFISPIAKEAIEWSNCTRQCLQDAYSMRNKNADNTCSASNPGLDSTGPFDFGFEHSICGLSCAIRP